MLNNVSEKINIVVIHKNIKKFKKFEKLFLNHNNLNFYNLLSIEINNKGLKNLSGKHVSEATYYRLFLDQVLINSTFDIQKCIYLDADIICLNNPLKIINQSFDLLKQKNLYLAARTEVVFDENPGFFKRLNLKGKKYFNAGVIMFDYQQWVNENIFPDLRNILLNSEFNLDYWDQDVLNAKFDGKYIEVSQYLNFPISMKKIYPVDYVKSNVLLLHYQGNRKPWHINEIDNKNSLYFQESFSKIFKKNIYIQGKNTAKNLNDIKKFLYSNNEFSNKIKLQLIFNLIKSNLKIF